MFIVSCPDNCRAERRWITSVLMESFLGLGYELRFESHAEPRSYVCIEADGCKLEIADDFFARAEGNWLSEASLPEMPLALWDITGETIAPNLTDASLPVLFGAPGLMQYEQGARIGLDIFGAAFFMLSRYEEAVPGQRDEHDRFPAAASAACRGGFLHRPIVDEYVELLWSAIHRLWPQVKRRRRTFATVVSCDVDHPYHPGAASLHRMVRRSAGEFIRTPSLSTALGPLRNYVASRNGNWRHDPYYHAVDWMMDVNEKAGNRVAFYFIPEITDRAMDGVCLIGDRAVTWMLKRIAARGHEIGIHPGYRSYQEARQILSAKNSLQQALDKAGIRQQVAGGRQHYLRWSTRTPAAWHAAGLRYDSTLSYAERAGFRCGTCHEYPMYDLAERKPLSLWQRPLICMESSVIVYAGHGHTDKALDCMRQLKQAARKVNGSFTLLWHNSSLEAAAARDMYREIIA
jgi:hypothetical protein